MNFGKLQKCAYQPTERGVGYILFKDGKDIFKHAEVTLGQAVRCLFNNFDVYFKQEGEYEYLYDMIWCLFEGIPTDGGLANAIIRTEDFNIIRSSDNKLIGVRSKLTLEDIQKVMNVIVVNEDKISSEIREGFIEVYKFLEVISNEIDSNIFNISKDKSMSDILFQSNNPYQSSDGNPLLPIKHIKKKENNLLASTMVS